MKLEPTYKKVVLEKILFGLQDYMSYALLREIKLEQLDDFFTNSIITRIQGFLYGNTVHKREWAEPIIVQEMVIPNTWWDAFKLRWCPSILRKWLKVDQRVVSIWIQNHHHIVYQKVCPHLNIATPPNDKVHFEFLTAPWDK